jgi:hypothetical protein
MAPRVIFGTALLQKARATPMDKLELIRQRTIDCMDAMDPFIYEKDWASDSPSDSFNTLQHCLSDIHRMVLELQHEQAQNKAK